MPAIGLRRETKQSTPGLLAVLTANESVDGLQLRQCGTDRLQNRQMARRTVRVIE